ncbi:phage tail protein [Hylemonella sp. W303a]|uniref:phage tail protein n=1 Tax=Hylemonella sp. W303a TaxID=3389873 RepID=UPI00396B1B7A
MTFFQSSKWFVLLTCMSASLVLTSVQAADWSKPTLTDTYTVWPEMVKGRDEDAARLFDPATTNPTNLPIGTIRWSSANKRFEKFSGSSWSELEPQWAMGISGNAATASKWATPRTFTIGGVSMPVDGSTSVTWSRNDMGGVPVGAVMSFAGSTCPSGWLSAAGSEVNRATYPDLFSYIGTTYGAGNGSTTFRLPELRGEFVRGLDNGRGVDSGRALGTSQLDALQNITGSVAPLTVTGSWVSSSGAFSASISSTARLDYDNGAYSASTVDFDASRIARTAAETRPRNIALLYCIKAN